MAKTARQEDALDQIVDQFDLRGAAQERLFRADGSIKAHAYPLSQQGAWGRDGSPLWPQEVLARAQCHPAFRVRSKADFCVQSPFARPMP